MLMSFLLACASPFLPGGVVSPSLASTPRPDWYKDVALLALDETPLPHPTVAGKVVLVVNVASKCGFTTQYEGLETLYEKYKDRGLVILGAPCNQFGGQEPGKPEEIASFCRLTYGVSFPMLAKQDVNGPGRSALFSWLIASPAGANSSVKWNFEKFLIGRDGNVIGRWRSVTTPESAELVGAIEAALGVAG